MQNPNVFEMSTQDLSDIELIHELERRGYNVKKQPDSNSYITCDFNQACPHKGENGTCQQCWANKCNYHALLQKTDANAKRMIWRENFDGDPNLSKYTTAMLFDSGNLIATGKYMTDAGKLIIDLFVASDVSVTYKGETYREVSDFPDELVELIKLHPTNFQDYAPFNLPYDMDKNHVSMKNRFEYSYSWDNGPRHEIIAEEDIHNMSLEELGACMDELAVELLKSVPPKQTIMDITKM